MRVHWFLILASCLMCACPPSSGSGTKSDEPVAKCTSAGASCLFAPGKLGLCVESSEPCKEGKCYVCQSQH